MANALITRCICVSQSNHDKAKKPFKRKNGVSLFEKPISFSVLSSRSFYCLSTSTSASVVLDGTVMGHQILDRNAEICGFCEVGNLKKAMELLYENERLDLELKTYCSVLQLCADLKSLDDGRKVHSIISRKNIELEGLLGAKVVFMYVTCGDLKQGRRVFDEIGNEKVFLWNLLINEYAKIGDFSESVSLYSRMVELGISANDYTFSCVLKCFASLGDIDGGEMVHAYLLKLGFGHHTAVVNSLIGFYSRRGRVDHAEKLFEKMFDRDVISWNSMISGYVTNGLAERGLEIFNEMVSLGVVVDSATLVSVLAACADIGNVMLCGAIHAYAMKKGLAEKVTISNTLLDVYMKCGDIDSALNTFDSMGVKTAVSWTSLISGYAREGLCDEAIEVFYEMIRHGVKPDAFTITSVLHACATGVSLENGMKIHDYIVENNMEPDLVISNALIDMYSKCGTMQNARSVFSSMPVKDVVSWNTMIGGYTKNNLPNEALVLFSGTQRYLKPDSITVTCVLPACASLGDLARGREIHGFILRRGFSSELIVTNALVDMYVKCGALVIAKSLFAMIEVKDLISWTVMIAGYAMHGYGREAIAAFNAMRRKGHEPNEACFICILYACSHSGLLETGWEFFGIMRKGCNIEPDLEHYACMVDLLARAGKLTEAYRFIATMPIKPDPTIWESLLSGCRIFHNVELAEKVAEHLFELEPDNTKHFVLLAKIYSEAEKWENVNRLREKKIGHYELTKEPSCSWTEIKGQVHVFVSGHNKHPQARQIESLSRNARKRMLEKGYLQKTKYSLISADDIQKEVALCGHTEIQAIAFAILRSLPGRTIRVSKNDRTCRECHEMAKFMSKLHQREILLRDSNRFHHFEDGCCSCRG